DGKINEFVEGKLGRWKGLASCPSGELPYISQQDFDNICRIRQYMVDILEGSLRAQRGQQQQEHDSQSATTTGAVEDGSKAAAAGSSSLSLYRRIPEGFPLHLAIIKVFNVRTQSYCDVIVTTTTTTTTAVEAAAAASTTIIRLLVIT
ncbi:hypothetical protein FOZ63_016152, partial [Perkinsus olseni]